MNSKGGKGKVGLVLDQTQGKERPESKMASKRYWKRAWEKQAAVRQRQAATRQWRTVRAVVDERQGGFVYRNIKVHSSLHRHTQLREPLLFSPVPAQAVVSVDLKSVSLPPKLKSFDKVKWKELGTRDYILYERKHPEEANLEKWTAR